MLKKSILKSFELKVVGNFSTAHRLRGYRGGYMGKCEELHGHNWKVELAVVSRSLNKSGMVEDFTKLKKILNVELKKLDHKYLNTVKPFDRINPTCENIAKYLFDSCNLRFRSRRTNLRLGDASPSGRYNLQLIKVTVWENETQCASYGISGIRDGY